MRNQYKVLVEKYALEVEARKFSTPEEDNYWEVVIGNYIEKLTTANTFEEFVNAAKTKPATFQQNPSMYYHDKIFIDVINKKFGENNSATKASFIDTMTSAHSTLAYIDLLYRANEDTPMIKREMAEIKKKFNTWLEYRADWYAAKDLHKKNAEITGVDTSGLVEASTNKALTYWAVAIHKAAERIANKHPSIYTSDQSKAKAQPPDFWTLPEPTDGSFESVRNAFLNVIKQGQYFDLQNGGYTPVPGVFKKAKYNSNRIGSFWSSNNGIQFTPGNLNTPKVREKIEDELIDRARRYLLYNINENENPEPDIRVNLFDLILNYVTGVKLESIKEMLEDYFNSQELHKKNAEITGVDTSGLLEARNKVYTTIDNRLETVFNTTDFDDFVNKVKDLYNIFYILDGSPEQRSEKHANTAIMRRIRRKYGNFSGGPNSYYAGYREDSPMSDIIMQAIHNVFTTFFLPKVNSNPGTYDPKDQYLAVAKKFFDRFIDMKNALELHKKNAGITGVDTSGLLEAISNSTPEEK